MNSQNFPITSERNEEDPEIDSIRKAYISHLAHMRHDLYAPLSTIKGFVTVLLEDSEGKYNRETQHRFLSIINNECDRATAHIGAITDSARAVARFSPRLEFATTDILPLIQGVFAAERERILQQGLEIRLQCDIELEIPLLLAEEPVIVEMLGETVAAAIRAAGTKGKVTLTAKQYESEIAIAIFAEQNRNSSPDAVETPANFWEHGTGKMGIGVFLARYHAEAHGGSLNVTESAETGTVHFLISLPIPNRDTTETADTLYA